MGSNFASWRRDWRCFAACDDHGDDDDDHDDGRNGDGLQSIDVQINAHQRAFVLNTHEHACSLCA